MKDSKLIAGLFAAAAFALASHSPSPRCPHMRSKKAPWPVPP